MFLSLEKLFLKPKYKRVISFIEEVETNVTLFLPIDISNEKTKKAADALSKSEYYSDVSSRYSVCLEKAKNHNKRINELTFTFNSLVQEYPIVKILDGILDYSVEKVEEIYSTIKDVYKYVIPNSFKHKREYDSYKSNVEDILKNFHLIQEQKKAIISINGALQNLPDVYLDEGMDAVALSEVNSKLKNYKLYKKQYYPAPIINASTISQHNQRFIEKHLNDPIFDNINGKSLDNEQRRSILCNSKSNLTIAGAGAGKTLTICGKVKYLLESGLAQKNEILLLSYSKASASDLETKVNGVAEGITVETFHALGLKILTEANGKKKAIEEQLKSYITLFFKETA